VSSSLAGRATTSRAKRGYASSPGSVLTLTLLVVATLLVGCTLSRPDQLIEPDVVGLVTATNRRSLDLPLTVELADQSLEIERASAVELTGPGIDADRLLLYGEDAGRIWYASAAIQQTSSTSSCYALSGDAAFDAADAVILVFAEWPEVGLRLPKRADFVAPPHAVSSETGRYILGEAGELAIFCLDPDGAVFGLAWLPGGRPPVPSTAPSL
jgi:hypothetical protein